MDYLKQMISDYQTELQKVNDKIKSLKSELKKARNPHQIYDLRSRIEKYEEIQYDLSSSIHSMKEYFR